MLNSSLLFNKGYLPLFSSVKPAHYILFVHGYPVLIKDEPKVLRCFYNTNNTSHNDEISFLLSDHLRDFYSFSCSTKKTIISIDDSWMSDPELKILVDFVEPIKPCSVRINPAAYTGFNFEAKSSSLLFFPRTVVLNEEEQALFDKQKEEFESSYPGISLADYDDEVKVVFNAIKNNNKIKGIIIAGPAGTGKSVLARYFAYLLGMPCMVKQAGAETSPDTLLGSDRTNPDPTSPHPFAFVAGELAKYMKKGQVFVLDEVNYSPVESANLFNQCLDGTKIFNHDQLHFDIHENFLGILTCNCGADYPGVNQLSPALKSRCLILQLKPMDMDRFLDYSHKHLESNVGITYSDAFLKELFSFVEYFRTLPTVYQEAFEVCIRNSNRLLTLISYTSCTRNEFGAAINTCFTNGLSLDNDNLERIRLLQLDPEYVQRVDKLYELYSSCSAALSYAELEPGSSLTDFVVEDEEEIESLSDSLDDLDVNTSSGYDVDDDTLASVLGGTV